MCALGALFETN